MEQLSELFESTTPSAQECMKIKETIWKSFPDVDEAFSIGLCLHIKKCSTDIVPSEAARGKKELSASV